MDYLALHEYYASYETIDKLIKKPNKQLESIQHLK